MSLKAKEKEAWRYYKIWMHEKTYSKALKTNIRITRKGWDHIKSGSKIRKRKIKDKYSRFQLLKLAKFIIKNSSAYEISYKDKQKYYVMRYKLKREEITVLIKDDQYGNKYLFSVFKH